MGGAIFSSCFFFFLYWSDTKERMSKMDRCLNQFINPSGHKGTIFHCLNTPNPKYRIRLHEPFQEQHTQIMGEGGRERERKRERERETPGLAS